MRIVAGNKLAFIKTGAVVQEEFDISHDQFFAVLVNGMLQFIVDL